MTNLYLYVKITNMKLYTIKLNKLFLTVLNALLCLLFALTVVCGVVALHPTTTVFATDYEEERVFPSSDVEQTSLNALKDFRLFGENGDNFVILHDVNKLLFYMDGQTRTVTKSTSSGLHHVKKLNDDALLVVDYNTITKIDVSGGVDNITLSPLFDTNGDPITCTFYDINDSRLITCSDTVIKIYLVNDDYTFTYTADAQGFDSTTPIAINSDSIFYVADGRLKKRSLTDIAGAASVLFTASPTEMTADDTYLYYVQNNKIYRMKVDDYSVKELVSDTEKFDLGTIASPVGLFADGNRLFVADAYLNAVSEFYMTENDDDIKLTFTGFAVAKGKTAFNRISAAAYDVEYYADYTAVCDENKLTVIKTDEFDPLSYDCFDSYFAEDLGGSLPSAFTVGDKVALLSFADGTLKTLALSGKNKGTVTTLDFTPADIIKDLCYRNGNFYVLTTNSVARSTVYELKQDGAVSETQHSAICDIMTVDVDGNIYFANAEKIFKNRLTEVLCDRNGVTKIATDLAGRLFACDGNALYEYDNASSSFIVTAASDGIKSFALDLGEKKIRLLKNGDEGIFYTSSLNNVSIDSLVIPADYKTTDKTTALSVFKPCVVTDGATVYSVKTPDGNNGFSFNGLTANEDGYVYICDIPTPVQGFTVAVLASNKGVALTDKTYVIQEDYTPSEAPQAVYVTTDVNAYYIPIITKENVYASSYDGDMIRLSKGAKVSPQSKIAFYGKEFYLATFTYGQETLSAFIPVDFTVETPFVISDYDVYTLEKVNKTAVYSDSALSVKVTDLNDGDTVRVYEKVNGKLRVAIKISDTEWSDAVYFISADAVKNDSGTVVINVLLIVLAVTSVCGTATYFLLRKKVKKS